MNTEPDSYEENVPDASELLDFELIAKSQPEKGQGLWLWVVLVLVLAGGGWAGWMYMQGQEADEIAANGTAPMILAPKFDLKQKPVDPGGMKVPDRDKLVYDRMAGEQGTGGAGQVERLLPPPEAPIAPPQETPKELAPKGVEKAAEAVPTPPAPPPAAPAAPAPKAEPVIAVEAAKEVAKVVPKSEPAPAPKPVVAKPEPAPVAAPVAAPAPKPDAKPAPAPAVTAKATGTAGQGYMVQLSAVRNEANAKGEWSRLAKKHPDVLGGLELVIQRADLGAKGVFYRVRAGWFANRAEAKAICDELAKRNVGCLIAKP